MSIERSGAASGPKPAAATEGQSGKGKSAAEADAPDAGGFLALMTSLEPVAEQVDAGSPPVTMEEEEAPIALLPTETPTPPTDLAMLLAQSGQISDSRTSSFADEALGDAKGRKPLAAPAIGAEKPDVSTIASDAPAVDTSGDVKQTVAALLDQMSQGKSGRSHRAGSVELQSGMAASLADARVLKQPTLMEVSTREPALSGALLTSGMGDGLLRQSDRAVAKASVFTSGYGAEGAWGQQTVQAGNRMDAAPVVVNSAALESNVADTVSYWVTQGVQNAQLKLDGFGGEAVEVSISLKGDEAHVGFRTDQPEIRQILEGAVAQLKELLGKEGLVLSGVSVGASGQNGAGAQEQRNRPGARQTSILTTEAVLAEGHRRPVNPTVGRALDLFV
jgi:flagellar hook-length control protein FliK